MAITKLTVENFKSIEKLEVELRPFNIVVGSNASGKSNFLDVFRFLRDIAEDSLESAVGSRGGGETLRNFYLDENEVLRVCVETDDVQRCLIKGRGDKALGVKFDKTAYEFSIRFDGSDAGCEVITDRFTEHFILFEVSPADTPYEPDTYPWTTRRSTLPAIDLDLYSERSTFGNGKALYRREGDSITCHVELPSGAPLNEKDLSVYRANSMDIRRPQEVMLERPPRTLFFSDPARSLTHISAFDFDPSKAQLAVPPTGSRKLDEDAENLSVILREILRSPESKKRLISLVSVLLPFVKDLDVEEFGFGQLMTTLTERFSDKGHRLPAYFASDGTVACLALVVALYFQENAVAVFEEPDRHIHPHLAGQVMQMMNEVTERTQVIVTTHNAELLRHANLEDILLVTRGPAGHSQITRPADSEIVNVFLQNELGVEDLFAQNLLDL